MSNQFYITRYILKKKYDRGSYGEVWLAFYWNCSHVIKSPKGSNFSAYTMNEGANNETRRNPSSADVCDDGPSNSSMFILKRIMVILISWNWIFRIFLRFDLIMLVNLLFLPLEVNGVQKFKNSGFHVD